MKNVAEEELEGQTQEVVRIKGELIEQLLPRDEADDSGCIVEVRAGEMGVLPGKKQISGRRFLRFPV